MDAKLKTETALATVGQAAARNAAGSGGINVVAHLNTRRNAGTNQGMEHVMRTAEDLMSIGQGNIEATTQSVQTVVNGLQDLARLAANSLQERAKETNEFVGTLARVKSPREAVELYSSLMRANGEKAVSDFTKMTEASFNLFQQAIAPLTQQITRTSEKFSTVAA